MVWPKGAVKIMDDNYDPEDPMGKVDWPHLDCQKIHSNKLLMQVGEY